MGLTLPASLCPSSAGVADGPRAPTHLARPEGPATEIHPGDQGRAAAVLCHQQRKPAEGSEDSAPPRPGGVSGRCGGPAGGNLGCWAAGWGR